MTNNAYKWQYIEDTGKFLETYKLFYLLRNEKIEKCWKRNCEPLSRVRLFVTSWTVAHKAPLSMEFLQTRILD